MPSAHIVYAGSYAPTNKPAIYEYAFDPETGSLTPRGSFMGIENPSFLALSPNGHALYAVSETGGRNNPGSVYALQLVGPPSKWRILGKQLSEGDAPCHLAIDPAGKWLIVSNYGSGTVTTLPILDDGALGKQTDVVRHKGTGKDPQRQEGPHAHSATLTPDRRFVIAADLGTDELYIYRLDHAAGKLIEHARVKTAAGSGPRHLAFHPSKPVVYVANELGNTVAVYAYDAEAGSLKELQVLSTVPEGATGSAGDIHVSPGGDRVYVSNRGHDSIATFEVKADGTLALLATPPCGGAGPRNFAISPENRFVLVANQNSGEITVLPVLPETLGEPVTRLAVPGVSFVTFAK